MQWGVLPDSNPRGVAGARLGGADDSHAQQVCGIIGVEHADRAATDIIKRQHATALSVEFLYCAICVFFIEKCVLLFFVAINAHHVFI